MGARYTIHKLYCPYCHYPNYEIYYAPDSNINTVFCERCGKESRVVMKFKLEKIENDNS